MQDFEVHPRGSMQTYLEEIRLSRALARTVGDAATQFDLPLPILEALAKLQSLYSQQMERGDM